MSSNRFFRGGITAAATLTLVSCQSSGIRTPGNKFAASFDSATTTTSSARPTAYAIAEGADLEDLVAAALSHHPSLQATRSRAIALDQAAVQAGALPDPNAMATGGRMAETAAGEVEATLGVQQKIPFPGKRGAAAEINRRQAAAMRAQLAAEELALAERVRTAYWDYYTATRTIAVIHESKEPLTTLRNSVEARVATNKAGQRDLLRLENEITRLDQRLATSGGRRSAAAATLNALLFRPHGSSLPAPRGRELRLFESPASLIARAGREHPEVQAAQARIGGAETGVRLAHLQSRPDFTVGVGYSPVSDGGLAPSANGRDQVTGTLGLSLPIWGGKNKAARNEAAAKLEAEQASLAATQSALQQRIDSAHAAYTGERSALALYAGKLIPDAQQSFELSVTGYQSEKSTFLDVIDAWRQLLTYRLEREENRGRVGKADATLRSAAGLR